MMKTRAIAAAVIAVTLIGCAPGGQLDTIMGRTDGTANLTPPTVELST
jgi:hypothetical protein